MSNSIGFDSLDIMDLYDHIDLSVFEGDDDNGWVMRREVISWIYSATRESKFFRKIFKDFIEKTDRYNVTWMLIREIKKMVKNRGNLQLHFFGSTMSGKSWASMKIASLIRNVERESRHKDSALEFEFSLKKCQDKIRHMKSGDVLWRDEQNKASGEGKNIMEEANENLRKSVREANVHFVDAQPYAVISGTLNFVIHMLGYNKKENISLGILYVCIPKVSNPEQIVTKALGYVIFGPPDDDQLLEEYGQVKRSYMRKLLDNGGLESANLGGDIVTEYLEEFLHRLEHSKYKNYPLEKKADWDLMYTMLDMPRFGGELPKRVIRLAWTKYKMGDIEFLNNSSSTKGENPIPYGVNNIDSTNKEGINISEADFYDIFISESKRYLKQQKHLSIDDYYIDCYAEYYCVPSSRNVSWRIVKQNVHRNTRKPKADSIRRYVQDQLMPSLTNDDKGNCLEIALLVYFNSIFSKSPFFYRLISHSNLPDGLTLVGDSQDNLPDLLSFDGQLAINCKNYSTDKASELLHVSPEYKYPECWVAYFSQEYGVKFFNNKNNKEHFKVKFTEGHSVEEFAAYLKKKFQVEYKTMEALEE